MKNPWAVMILTLVLTAVAFLQMLFAVVGFSPSATDVVLKVSVLWWIGVSSIFGNKLEWEIISHQPQKKTILRLLFFLLVAGIGFGATVYPKMITLVLWVNLGAAIVLLRIFTCANSFSERR